MADNQLIDYASRSGEYRAIIQVAYIQMKHGDFKGAEKTLEQAVLSLGLEDAPKAKI